MKPTKQKSFLNSMKWAYAGNWGDRAFNALFTFILAAVLGPRDFGIVSISMIYVAFLQMFLDQGLATALIQRKSLEKEHLDAVFWVNLALSAFLILISLAFAHRWAEANHAPEVALIAPLLSLSILFESFSLVQISILKREMNFRSLTIRSNVSILISGTVGITLALSGFGIWSLVAQQLIRDASAVLLLWKMSSWRPRFNFSWKHFKELLGFSIPNFIAQLGIFADGQAGSIALGMLFGPTAVGLFRVAEKVTGSLISMAMAATQSVSLPEFARHQDNPAKLRETALNCVRLAATVTLPALAGLAVVSAPLMATIGQQWAVAANVLKVLCAAGGLGIFTYFTGPLLQALGKTRTFAVMEWSRTVIGLLALSIAAFYTRNSAENWQIMGIAFARLVTAFVFTAPLFVYLLLKLCKLSLRDFLRPIKPAAVASLAILGAVLLFQAIRWFSESKPQVLLAMEVVIGAIVGIPVLLSLDQHLRASLEALFRRVLSPKYPEAVEIETQSSASGRCSLEAAFVPIWPINPYHCELIRALNLSSVGVRNPLSLKAIYQDRTENDHNMDILHLHALPYLDWKPTEIARYVMFFWRLRMIQRRGIPVIWTVHEIYNHDTSFRRIESLFAQTLARHADALIVHGETAKQMVIERFGIKTGKINVVNHGNYIRSYENKISREAARTSLGLESCHTILLFFGHLRPYKGILEMVAAFRKIDNPNARLVISGLPIKNMEKEIALSIGDDHRIKFKPGRVNDSDVQVLMNACDMVVLPYKRILTSGAAVLAMSFGKACIAPRLGCVTDMLDETGAIFFEPSIDADLERALREAVFSQQKLAAMGLHNLNKAAAWEWDGIGTETAAIYRRCIAARQKQT